MLPLPPLFFFLVPFFHLSQINRVALIQCVSRRLPGRLFDPVFQSLPLGQTCFSSVCCTPALAAASLRQTMGCCACPPPSCRFHFFKALSLFLPVFFLRLPPFSHSIAFGRGSSHPSAWASRISLKTALLGWEERTGDLFLSSTPTPCSLCLCS